MRKDSSRACLLIACAALAVGACGGGGGGGSPPPSTPPVTRPGVLSISANPRPIPPPQAADFLAAFDLAYNAGARGQVTTYTWSRLEPQPGVYDVTDIADTVNFAGISRGMTLFVGIQIINTVKREMPADIATSSFDDPAVIARFRALLDAVIPSFQGRVRYLSIGNEVDVYFAAYPNEWGAYKTFYRNIADYARSRDANLRVGVTGTVDGALGAAGTQLADLNTSSDVVVLTYYPLAANFAVRPVSAPNSDFPLLLQFAAGKPLVFQEVGYPAATLLGSSDAAQASFVTNVFEVWRNSSGRIELLNFFLLHDFTQQQCDFFGTYYGLPNSDRFKTYLCTLGLRREDGAARAAWNAMVSGAQGAGLP